MPIELQEKPSGFIMGYLLAVGCAGFVTTNRDVLALRLCVCTEAFDGCVRTRTSPLARNCTSVEEPVPEVSQDELNVRG